MSEGERSVLLFGVKKETELPGFSPSDEIFAVKPIDWDRVSEGTKRSVLAPTPFATLLLTI